MLSGSDSDKIENGSSDRKSQRVSPNSAETQQRAIGEDGRTPRVTEGEHSQSQRKKSAPISIPHE